MLFEPHQGWRHVDVTAQGTAEDFAHQMRDLVDVHYPQATLISIVALSISTLLASAVCAGEVAGEARRHTVADWRLPNPTFLAKSICTSVDEADEVDE